MQIPGGRWGKARSNHDQSLLDLRADVAPYPTAGNLLRFAAS
jgi:hypothetical protein